MDLLSDLRWLRSVEGLFLLLALPGMIHGDCIFGPNNTDKLILRNNMIVSFMNATLRNFTEYGEKDIASVSNFKLTDYLTNTYLLTAENYLQFVSLGRMLKTDWVTATSNAMTNETTPRAVATIIITNFVTPLHDELQKIAGYYSFSYGIFRPPPNQFNFTGITPGRNSTENATFDLSCSAGSYFIWRLSTDLTYYSNFSDRTSPQFAKIATVVEQAVISLTLAETKALRLLHLLQFDQYYRQNTAFNKDFVRASVVYANGSQNYLILFMEAYFLNGTLQSTDISSRTSLSGLPTISYTDPLSSGSATTVNFRSSYSLIISASYAPPSTTRLPTTTRSTMSTVTTTETSSTTITPPLVTNSNAPSLLNTSTIPTTSSEFPTSSPTIQSAGVNTNNSSITSVTVANFSQGPLTAQTHSTSFPTIPTNLSAQTTLSSTTISNTPTTLYTLMPFSSPTSNDPSRTPAITNIETSTSMSSTFPPGIGSSAETTLIILGSSALLTSQLSSTTLQNSAPNVTEFYNPTINTTITISNSTLTQSSLQSPGNLSTPTTRPTLQNGSTGTQPDTSISKTVIRGTTFDPDPFFQAEVPVITKVYNDYFLLRKMGTMQPLTEKSAFWTITLPAAIGFGIAIIGCMLCWQTECSYGKENSKI